jgi:hypothetical protein
LSAGPGRGILSRPLSIHPYKVTAMRTQALRVCLRTLVLLVAATAGACSGTESSSKAAEPATPQTPEAYRDEAARLRREGKHKEAADTALKAFVLAGSGPRVLERIELAKAFAAGANAATSESDRAKATAGAINEIKQLENEKLNQNLAVDEVDIAEVYAILGDPNAAFRWLMRALDVKSPNLQDLSTNPDLEAIRSDPRWQQLQARMPR